MFYSFDFSVLQNFFSFTTIKVNDIIEIGIIIILFYNLLKHLKGTRAWVIAKGCLILFALYGFAYFAAFNVITYIAGSLVTFLIIALVIMFQPELRKLLEGLGRKNITLKKILRVLGKNKEEEDFSLYSNKSIDEIVKSVNVMSKAKTGALILIEKNSSLSEYETSGIRLNADISSQLIINAFEKNTPLHDGAMILRHDTISAATCYLPLSDNRNINKDLGTRHRAAIGASEETDALIIVVSEETGAISIVENGEIEHNVAIERLRETLVDNKIQVDSFIDLENEIKTKPSYKKTALVIASFIFGIALWSFITIVVDPVVTVEYDNIPVTIINDDALNSAGYVYEVEDGKTVDIFVTGQKSHVGELSINNFTAIADAKEVSITNSITIDVSSNKNNNHIKIDTKNAMTTVSIEEEVSIECTIETIKSSIESDGYFVSELTPLTKSITITGPQSMLHIIDKAVASINVSNKTENFEVESDFVIYDKNGDIITLTNCELSADSVIVKGKVLHTKSVPLNITAIDSSLEDCVVDINKLTIDSKSDKILIASDDDILNDIDVIDVNLDVASTSPKVNVTIKLENYMPENVYYADSNDELPVSMEITRTVINDVIINSSDISIKNGDGSIHNSSCDIKLQYDYEQSDLINSKNLKPFVDLSGLSSGTHRVPIQFDNDENISIIEETNVSITIE